MDQLIKGVCKFQQDIFPQHKRLFQKLADQQNPHSLFITCADSRIEPSLITQSNPGDLFLCRNAGNMVPPYGELHGGVSATIEYAVMALDVQNVIVCGHTDCGAMKGVLDPEKVSDLPTVKSWLRHGEVARRVVKENHSELRQEQILAVLTEQNVVAQIQNLKTHPSVAARLARGRLTLHAWVYDIENGRVRAYDGQRGDFVPIDQYRVPVASPQSTFQLAG